MRWILGIAVVLACAFASPARALGDSPSNYPPLLWLPAAEGNFTVGRGGEHVTTIVIHQTEGSYRSALSWFRRPGSMASAHYLIRASDGEIAQLVAESNTAYHASSANYWTIGIEHEFFLRRGILFTEVQYRSSAALVCAIARRYDIPIDRNHIVGHRELPNQFHGDPGPLWDWTYYMSLVRSCAGGDGRATVSSIETCGEPGCTPPGGLEFGDELRDLPVPRADEVVRARVRAGPAEPVDRRRIRAIGLVDHDRGDLRAAASDREVPGRRRNPVNRRVIRRRRGLRRRKRERREGKGNGKAEEETMHGGCRAS